ncbi:DUF3558 domain-containing protein [Nocardia cyriacigeorgica]|uniref:DUF3558 domain-containing protein n=1 Tax=Nocardia cyriacigeorgica TaxID=135487 RepID=A0ABX0CI47_9NOCA|nr:DUF3558 domain-containing protein [Nocardia cyriacigeorgica]NEW55576.1 DUF3558 domain-containing protein [Nocardia cyriacigeorgica]
MAAAAVALLAAGCGSTTEGEPTAAGSDTATTTRNLDEIEIFNPCSGLSDDVLQSIGLDPSTKSVTTDAPSGPATWRVCGWYPEGRPYKITVYSTSHTLDESRANDDLTGFNEVAIGPRSGVTFRDKSTPEGDGCYAAFSAEQGMFEISADWTSRGKRDVDICTLAIDYATQFEPHLPK